MISSLLKWFVRVLITQLFATLVLGGLLQAQPVSFIARRDFVPGGFGIAVADVNNDGKADVVVANGSTVSVMLGNGDGTFQQAINVAAGQSPIFVAVADVNGDGKPDLLVLSQFGAQNISVLLGNGNGTFQPPISVFVDPNPTAIAVGDFNGDGKLDLAVTCAGFQPGTVAVLLGNGNGTFMPRQSFSVGNNPVSVAIGDLNGDGKLDIAVANSGSNNVSVLLGNGNGSFQLAINTPVDSSPKSLTIADFDGDHKLDLAVANTNSDDISVLLGRGDGSFQVPLNVAVAQNPVFVATADLNGDQIPDLVVAHSPQFGGPGSVSVLLGIGDGSFQAPANFAVSQTANAFALDDFNGDGFKDIVVSETSFSAGSSISEFLGNGDGTFQSAAKIATVGAPTSIAMADFDGDGNLDLAVTTSSLGSMSVSIFLGNGDGTFRPGTTIPLSLNPASIFVVVGDFNNDGVPDLAIGSSSSITILLGNGDGTFQPPKILNPNITVSALTVADFDSDGNLDLVAAGSGFGSSAIVVLLGNGDGTFLAPKGFTTPNTIFGLAAGDFNGDGQPDLVTANSNADTVSVFLGNGDGTFSQPRDIPVGRSPIAVAVGDLNGDGFADIVAANSNSGNVSILLGDGRGGFQAAFNFAVGGNPSALTLGDFNNDGRLDVAVTNAGANTVSVLLNAGTSGPDEIEPLIVVRTFPAANFGVGTNPGGLVAGDFNNDSLLDLVTVDRGSNGLSVLINNTRIAP